MKIIKKLAQSRVIVIASLAIYLGLIGPYLVSAPDNLLVILGIVLGLAAGAWVHFAFFDKKEQE